MLRIITVDVRYSPQREQNPSDNRKVFSVDAYFVGMKFIMQSGKQLKRIFRATENKKVSMIE
jgi:hypothetical protein